jgi:hypothetical protein
MLLLLLPTSSCVTYIQVPLLSVRLHLFADVRKMKIIAEIRNMR